MNTGMLRRIRSLSAIDVRCMAVTAIAAGTLVPLAANAKSERSGVAPLAVALSSQATIDGWVAFAAVVIGAFLAVLYVRGMYLVLHYASATYNVSLDRVDDADYSSDRERRLLSIGSVVLVLLSALIIASYGLGWQFLYIGPALSLLGPIVIIASMESDIRKYRRVLGKPPGHKASSPRPSFRRRNFKWRYGRKPVPSARFFRRWR